MSSSKWIGIFALLITLSLFACSDDDNKTNEKQLVTNAKVLEDGEKVNPGDIIHIVADGFQEGDEIMLDFYWKRDDPTIPEGSLRAYRAEIIERTANSLLIQMPYRKPESRVEILLWRGGNLMKMGEVRLNDGQTPSEYRLYGINNNLHKKVLFRDLTQIESMQLTEETTPSQAKWQIDEHPDFHSTVNASRTYGLCGLAEESGIQKAFFFDFYTSKWKKLANTSTLALAGNGNVVVAILGNSNGYSALGITHELDKSELSSETRSTKGDISPIFTLPKDLKPEYFGDYPGVFTRSSQQILLSADKGEGVWVPVVFDVTKGFHELDEVKADALIPFSFFISQGGKGTAATLHRLSGYIITSEKEGSQFCLIDETNMKLQEAFTTFPNRVASVTSTPERQGSFTVHFIAYRAGFLTEEFIWDKKEWKSLTWGEVFDEIVWAN